MTYLFLFLDLNCYFSRTLILFNFDHLFCNSKIKIKNKYKLALKYIVLNDESLESTIDIIIEYNLRYLKLLISEFMTI